MLYYRTLRRVFAQPVRSQSFTLLRRQPDPPVGDEIPNRGHIRILVRRAPLSIKGARVRARLKQHTHRVLVALEGGKVQRRLQLDVGSVEINAGHRTQESKHIRVTTSCRTRHSRGNKLAASIDGCRSSSSRTGGKQRAKDPFDDASTARVRGPDERRVAFA